MNAKKRKVLESSLILFTQKGFRNTSIQDIIKHANISKGTFYNYFTSKNECFLAILENTRYEASLRRHELLDGQDKKDRHILAKQVAVLLQLNREQNLFVLFEGIFQSSDEELKNYIAHHRLYEIQWMTSRLIDVYGEEARLYAYEAAILLFGMMQNLAYAYRTVHGEQLEPVKLVSTVLDYIHILMPYMIEKKEVLLNCDSLQLLETQLEEQQVTASIIYERLSGFLQRLPNEPNPTGEQFTIVLLEEFERDELRLAIIEVLLKPFREAFTNTSHESEAREIVHLIWTFITQSNTEQSIT